MSKPTKKYTLKSDKSLDNWLFHEDYFNEQTDFLPMSIQRELVKRLTTNVRNRVSPDQLKELNPIIEVKLQNICAAYRNKQDRSRATSRKRRDPNEPIAVPTPPTDSSLSSLP